MMLKFDKLLTLNVVAQIAMVVIDHFTSLPWFAPAFGTGIPFILGVWYGMKLADSFKTAAVTAFLAGLIGAFIGVVVAILLGDQTPALFMIALPSSSIAGMIGALISFAIFGRK